MERTGAIINDLDELSDSEKNQARESVVNIAKRGVDATSGASKFKEILKKIPEKVAVILLQETIKMALGAPREILQNFLKILRK